MIQEAINMIFEGSTKTKDTFHRQGAKEVKKRLGVSV
jgi:hypothetical protein